VGRIHYGRHAMLEDEADRLIKASLSGVTKQADILTPWKQQERLRREVYTQQGFPDESVRKGMFGRVANRSRPDLNSRDGRARNNRMSTGLSTHIQEYGGPDKDE
jgi:hypothetical protein